RFVVLGCRWAARGALTRWAGTGGATRAGIGALHIRGDHGQDHADDGSGDQPGHQVAEMFHGFSFAPDRERLLYRQVPPGGQRAPPPGRLQFPNGCLWLGSGAAYGSVATGGELTPKPGPLRAGAGSLLPLPRPGTSGYISPRWAAVGAPAWVSRKFHTVPSGTY